MREIACPPHPSLQVDRAPLPWSFEATKDSFSRSRRREPCDGVLVVGIRLHFRCARPPARHRRDCGYKRAFASPCTGDRARSPWSCMLLLGCIIIFSPRCAKCILGVFVTPRQRLVRSDARHVWFWPWGKASCFDTGTSFSQQPHGL